MRPDQMEYLGHQADQFLAFYAKSGQMGIRDAFQRWARSKDLMLGDRVRIRRLVKQHMRAHRESFTRREAA